MKKIFLVLFISFILLSSFLFFPLPKAQAQIPTPASQSIQIPGVTCGDAEAEKSEVKKCCLSNNYRFSNLVNVPADLCIINEGPIKMLCPANIINPFIGFLLDSPIIKTFSEQYLPELEKQMNPCTNGNPSTSDYLNPSCICVLQPATTIILCDRYLKDSKDYSNCVSCSNQGVWTSIGCVKNDLNSFIVDTVFGFGIGLAGVFSLLCIIYAAFMMQSSQGNPEKLKKAQEMITSCIMGLMLIIFSVFILKLIGVSILKIPGFG